MTMNSNPIIEDAPAEQAPAMDVDTQTSATNANSAESSIDTQLKLVIADALGLEANDTVEFDADTGLFGHLPELDSMAVATLLTAIEDRLDIVIEDDEVDGEMLETYGGLLSFVETKLAEG